MKYLAEIEASVNGIPLILGIINFSRTRGSFSATAESDLDYYGWAEYDYDVLDEEGKPAKHLESQMTDKDRDRYHDLIIEAL